MIGIEMRILLMALLLAASPAFAQTRYDGAWTVTTRTKTGSCDATASYSLSVAEGKVSGPAGASGSVGRSGNVRVSIGPAYANGGLHGGTGSGRWNASSGGVPCSGVWVASKQ